jgi:hypothetical protein
MWASRDYSTVTSICGLFLDVLMVFMFVIANLIVPFLFAAHYFTFPCFPIYIPSALPYRMANNDVIYYGCGFASVVGMVIFTNALISAALLAAMGLRKSFFSELSI